MASGKRGDCERCADSLYEVIEKKRKIDDDKSRSELSDSKVSPLQSSLRGCSDLETRDDKVGSELSDLKVSPLGSSSSYLRRCPGLEMADDKGRSEQSELKVSPLRSSSEHVKELFISYSLENGVHWYKIDPRKNINCYSSESVLAPVCIIPYPEIALHSGSVALGSKIFMMGGYIRGNLSDILAQGSADVFSFDTNSKVDSFEWRKEPTQLLAKRATPALVATHGKIYVFGDNKFCPKPWAEVYNPETNLFSPLADPPPELTIKGFEDISTALVANGDKIIWVQGARASSFDVINGLWTQISVPFCKPMRWSLGSVVVGDLIFTFDNGDVLAYDCANGVWFERPVQGLDIISVTCFGRVLNLGNGSLFVLWYDRCRYWGTYKEQYGFGCLTFQVTRVNSAQGSYLFANVMNQSAYCVGGETNFHDCIAM